MTAYLRYRNVLGYCVGRRIRDGENLGHRVARVFVRTKRPLHRIPIPQRIPARLQVTRRDERMGWVETDVVELGEQVRFASDPIHGGDRLDAAETGTVAVCFTNGVDGKDYALSCSHLFDPSSSDDSGIHVRLATGELIDGFHATALELDWSGLPPDGPNVDGALLEIPESARSEQGTLRVRDLPTRLSGVLDPSNSTSAEDLFLYSRVRSRFLFGSDLDTGGTMTFVRSAPGPTAVLTNVLSLRMDARRGDSGSLLVQRGVDNTLWALALLVGVGGGRTFFQPVPYVLKRFRHASPPIDIQISVEDTHP